MAAALPHESGDRWLDPCCGDGSLVRAVVSRWPTVAITAVDLDRQAVRTLKASTIISGIDFLRWSRQTTDRFSKIILNPPYVALRRLSSALRRSALACHGIAGEKIDGNANYWYVFFLQAIRVLDQGGSLCIVLPAAWDYANYASRLRTHVRELFERVDIHRSQSPLFEGVRDGSVVVVARGKGHGPGIERRFEYSERKEFLAGLESSRIRAAGVSVFPVSSSRGLHERFEDLFELRIGAVTGDARYFLISEARRMAMKLPLSVVTPVVSRAAHIRGPEIDLRHWKALLRRGDRVWLFRPPRKYPRSGPVLAYLRRAVTDGGCDRSAYKIQNRKPWYVVPVPLRGDGFLSGMAGDRLAISWREMDGLTATNTLYVIRCRTRLVRRRRFAWALAFLSSCVRNQLAARMRVYADGLSKLEPGDFRGILLPIPSQRPNAREVYRRAVELLSRGQVTEASAVADEWLGLSSAPASRAGRVGKAIAVSDQPTRKATG